MRPLCQACNKRLAAINCRRENKVYYRSRCDSCIRKSKKKKLPTPRWQTAGYRKKSHCDICRFEASYPGQIIVYHINGNCNDCSLINLRSICLNCAEAVIKQQKLWKRGDLEVDH